MSLIRIPNNLRPNIVKAGVGRNGKNLADDVRTILYTASQGLEVDALRLNYALMAAMSTVATRGAQSPDRRELAKTILAVAEYVQAKLEKADPPTVGRAPKDLPAEELEGWLTGA